MSRITRHGLLASGLLFFFVVLYLSVHSSSNSISNGDKNYGSSSLPVSHEASNGGGSSQVADSASLLALPAGVLTGGAIAPKLENATAKQELGRASWRLMHTMMARFPEAPSADESLALRTYVQLFARLYPCGDCASHFQMLLDEYPPQTSSRNAAAGWACFVHNEVNKRLHKELFDCAKIGDFYDCGCGDKDKEGEKGKGVEAGADSGKVAGAANGADTKEFVVPRGLMGAVEKV